MIFDDMGDGFLIIMDEKASTPFLYQCLRNHKLFRCADGKTLGRDWVEAAHGVTPVKRVGFTDTQGRSDATYIVFG